MEKVKLIVGITGASGVIMGYYFLKACKEFPNLETCLVTTECARLTWDLETRRPLEDLRVLADLVYDEKEITAPLASGSFITAGMVIIPCSMKTLAGIVSGYAENLLLRAADVCLKENRKLVLVPRETPLGKIHLRNLVEAADLGCVIIPPMLTFYNEPDGIADQIAHITGKILTQFGFTPQAYKSWQGGA